MKALASHPRVAATACAALLASLAAIQWRSGADAAPAPLLELLAWLFGFERELAARLVVGAELAAAAALLLLGTRVLAIAFSAAAAFVALACVSRGVSAGGLLPAFGALGSCLVVLLVAVRSRAASEPGRRGLSPAWTALATIAICTLSGNLVAHASRAEPSHDHGPAVPQIASIDLDMGPFKGRRIEETPVGSALPSLAGLIGNQTAFVVLYNPACSACHTLFEEHFATLRPELVVAVEVPPAANAIETGEEHGDISCAGCERMTLPVGPNWIVANPMVLRIERGIVTCVADRFGGNCFMEE